MFITEELDREVGFDVQIRKEASCTVWTRETGFTNLGRSRLCWGSSIQEYESGQGGWRDSGGYFPPTLSIVTHGPEEDLAISLSPTPGEGLPFPMGLSPGS